MAPVASATQMQWIGDAMITVERDGAQVHDGCRRKNDVTTRPDNADVESENPLAMHLGTKQKLKGYIIRSTRNKQKIDNASIYG